MIRASFCVTPKLAKEPDVVEVSQAPPFLTDTMASAFFYGTLMHPKILKRVLHNDASHLQICPAILTVGPIPSYHYVP